MPTQFEGKVAVITGAARGQGRSHAIEFAEQGADIIAVDLCAQIPSVAYRMADAHDLDDTVRLVEKTGRRIIAEQADVRDADRLKQVIGSAAAKLGRIDFVLANAGIAPVYGQQAHELSAYLDAIAVMLNGVYFTIEASLPAMLARGEGGAIVITSSAMAFKSVSPSFSTQSHGAAGYTAAKHGTVGIMRYFANVLAEKNIRVNSVHPTGVDTLMVTNPEAAEHMAAHPNWGKVMENLLPVPLVETADVTNAMLYLCGESGRYVTGVTLPVDAGLVVK